MFVVHVVWPVDHPAHVTLDGAVSARAVSRVRPAVHDVVPVLRLVRVPLFAERVVVDGQGDHCNCW